MFKLAIAFLAFTGLVYVETCDYMDEQCSMPYTKTMQKEIVAFHNELRSRANPTARNMEKMYWDDTIAKMALAHANKCEFEHDTSKDRRFAGYNNVGQNLFAGSAKPTALSPVNGWYGEKKWFTYGNASDHVVGHYTQVMRGQAGRIGCGGAYCPYLRLRFLVTCNYLEGQYNYRTPYELGKPCGDCPKSCKNNLCDCGGRKCQNGGTLNLNTCKCSCPKSTKGVTCGTRVCRKERWYCKYYKRYCSLKYGTKIRNMCPRTCKLC